MKFAILTLLAILVGLSIFVSADDFSCPEGQPATANLGDGVIMRTCIREKSPGNMVRAGPMEVTRNGIVILQVQTNAEGQLHGQFVSRDDDGNVIEQGNYANGSKVGNWYQVDENGSATTIVYREGVPVEP